MRPYQRIPYAVVEELRQKHADGVSMYRLSKLYKIPISYCSTLIHGAARQTEQSRPPVFAHLSRNEMLRHPSGKLFPRRPNRKGRRLIVAQIPWDTIVKIRWEHANNGTPLVDLAVMFGCSLSHVRRIVLKLTRRSA